MFYKMTVIRSSSIDLTEIKKVVFLTETQYPKALILGYNKLNALKHRQV